MKLLIMGPENNFCHEIKDSTDWKKEGVKVVGTALTETDAMQKIEKYLPDLILTDIKLQTGTVLGTIRKARKKGHKIRFAIITEHRNYEYMREAANLGVERVLPFPITGNKAIARLVSDVREKVTKETDDERKLKEHDLWKKERVLATLCYTNKKVPEDIKKYCEELKQSLSGGQYVVFLVETNNPEMVKSKLETIFNEERNYIGSFIGVDIVAGIQRFHLGASETHVRSSLKNFFERFCELCKRDRGVTVSVNISSIFTSSADIAKGFKQCTATQSLHFLYDDMNVTFYDDMVSVIQNISVPELYDKSEMENMLRNEKTAEIHRFFRTLLNVIKTNRVYNADVISGFYRNMAMDIVQLRINLCDDVADIQKTFEKITVAGKLVELSKKIENFAVDTINVLHDMKLQKSLTPVNKAIYYIEQNYRSDINLQGISDFVGLAPAYFSRLFKKEVGSSFIDFVMEKRVEKAKNLLAGTNMKIYEICQEVGYTDTRYFIKMFKGVTGMTPMQFKRSQYRKPIVEE